MKHQDNTVPAQKFNPPARCDAYMDNKFTGVCYVYDAAAWRNRNKRTPERHVWQGNVK